MILSGTNLVGYVRTGVVLGAAQSLTVMDVKVVTLPSAVILVTSSFAESLIAARWAVENNWRIRIGTGYLWGDEAVDLRGI